MFAASRQRDEPRRSASNIGPGACQCAASQAVVVRRRPSRLPRSHDSHVFATSRQRLEPRWPYASDIERRVITAPASRRAVHRGRGPSFACLLHAVRDWLQWGGGLSSSKVSSRRTIVLRRKLVSCAPRCYHSLLYADVLAPGLTCLTRARHNTGRVPL